MTKEYRWLPVEPTEEMLDAVIVNNGVGPMTARKVYKAMLAAAPTEPKGVGLEAIRKLVYEEAYGGELDEEADGDYLGVIDEVLNILAARGLINANPQDAVEGLQEAIDRFSVSDYDEETAYLSNVDCEIILRAARLQLARQGGK